MFDALSYNRLSYRAIRGLQICIVFSFTIFLQEWLRMPHAGWIGFSVMMIYVGFDHGTTLFRTFHRFWGMILGLISGFLLWFLGHVDFRLLILIIPLTIFFAYFLVGHAYSVPTMFTVNTAVIGTGYFSTGLTTTVNSFIYDYTAATIVALAICVFFEYFIFRRYGLMQRFISDTQLQIIQQLKILLELLNRESISKVAWFNACIGLSQLLGEVNNLVRNSEFEYSAHKAVGNEFNQFVTLTNQIFVNLKALYSAYYSPRYHKHDYNQVFNQVQIQLQQLESLINLSVDLTIKSGAIYNANK
ncbi:MAG: FUSC family protein [Burkholderiales bacterium]|nr:FUSC family protein [Burkholderiales bacterium]